VESVCADKLKQKVLNNAEAKNDILKLPNILNLIQNEAIMK